MKDELLESKVSEESITDLKQKIRFDLGPLRT